jgi:hypothetical protein
VAAEQRVDGRTKPQPEWIDAAALLYARGHSLAKVAAALNIATPDTVRYWLRKAGYVIRPPDEADPIKYPNQPQDIRMAPVSKLPPIRTLEEGGHLDRGIKRLEAAITDDRTRGYSAFTDGGQ